MQADLMARTNTHCHLMSALHRGRQKGIQVLKEHPNVFTFKKSEGHIIAMAF